MLSDANHSGVTEEGPDGPLSHVEKKLRLLGVVFGVIFPVWSCHTPRVLPQIREGDPRVPENLKDPRDNPGSHRYI